jgi:hypothetical protein
MLANVTPPARTLDPVDHRTRADVSCTAVVVVCGCGFRELTEDRAAARHVQVAHEAQYRPRKLTAAYVAARRATARLNASAG